MSVLIRTNQAFKIPTVHISEELLSLWRSSRQLISSAHEVFGILIGSQSEDGTEFWLEKCTFPMSPDSATRTSFNLQSPHHQDFVESCYASSEGKLGYLGTWHTHPEETPVPSSIDVTDWSRCISRNQDRKLVFVIVGQTHLCIFKEINGKFQIIFKDNINE